MIIYLEGSLPNYALIIENPELLLRNGLVNLHILESSYGNVTSGIEISWSLGVDTSLGFLDLVLSELDSK